MTLIIGNKEMPCAMPVKNWHETKLEFKPGDGARKRKLPIDLAIWHWTGGEGTAEGVFRTLDVKDYGVEFCIDRDGMIWQFADPILVDTFDAGSFNPRSVGTEIINYGFRDDLSAVPSSGRNRNLYDCTMRGKDRRFASFYAVQIRAAIALAEALSDAIPTLPRLVPGAGKGVFPNTMTSKQAKAFAGHAGHFHVSSAKSDPGFDLLSALAKAPGFGFSEVDL